MVVAGLLWMSLYDVHLIIYGWLAAFAPFIYVGLRQVNQSGSFVIVILSLLFVFFFFVLFITSFTVYVYALKEKISCDRKRK